MLAALKNSDSEAFDTLYVRYFSLLSRYAYRRLNDEKIIEELVQDVFVDIWKKRELLNADEEIGALLYAMVRNKTLHALRAQMIEAKHMEQFKLLQINTTTEEDGQRLDAKQLEARLQRAIDGLSPQCKEAFTLSRFENLSYKDIAARMGISVNTVEKHIGKALALLRLEFKEYNMQIITIIVLFGLAH